MMNDDITELYRQQYGHSALSWVQRTHKNCTYQNIKRLQQATLKVITDQTTLQPKTHLVKGKIYDHQHHVTQYSEIVTISTRAAPTSYVRHNCGINKEHSRTESLMTTITIPAAAAATTTTTTTTTTSIFVPSLTCLWSPEASYLKKNPEDCSNER